jgi:hypothetical protein
MADMNNIQACTKATSKLLIDRVFRDSVKDYVILPKSNNVNNLGFTVNLVVPHNDIYYIAISYPSHVVGNRGVCFNEPETPSIIECLLFNKNWIQIYNDAIGYNTAVYVSTMDELIAEIKRVALWRSLFD